jgi:lipid-binding SYLF domain-containing protein
MTRLTLLSTAAACGLALSTTAYAANDSNAKQIVNDSVQTVHEIRQDPHFAKLLTQAKGVFVLPSLVKGAMVVGGQGGQGGQGVLLARENGTWSDPAFLSIGSISIGAQAGGKAGPVVMPLMTDKALNDFTQANNFSLNGNAGLTIVTYSAHGQAPVGKGDVIVWSNASGAYGGVNVSGTDITSNTNEDQNYYGHKLTTTQIIHGHANNPQADTLRNALPS